MNKRMTTLIAASILGGSLALAGCSAADDDASRRRRRTKTPTADMADTTGWSIPPTADPCPRA